MNYCLRLTKIDRPDCRKKYHKYHAFPISSPAIGVTWITSRKCTTNTLFSRIQAPQWALHEILPENVPKTPWVVDFKPRCMLASLHSIVGLNYFLKNYDICHDLTTSNPTDSVTCITSRKCTSNPITLKDWPSLPYYQHQSGDNVQCIYMYV